MCTPFRLYFAGSRHDENEKRRLHRRKNSGGRAGDQRISKDDGGEKQDETPQSQPMIKLQHYIREGYDVRG